MKLIYVNTASVFSSDYKSYGFLKTGSKWEHYSTSFDQVLKKQNPDASHFLGRLSDLRERRRLCTLWISKAERRGDLIVSCTLTGLESRKRTDFSGRIIYDSINVTYSSLDEQVGASEFPDDVLAIAAKFAMSAVDLRWNLDGYADLKSFEADEFPFIDISSMYRGIAAADPMTEKYAFTKAQGLNPAHEIRRLAKSLGLRLINADELVDEKINKEASASSESRASAFPKKQNMIVEIVEEVEERLESVVGERMFKDIKSLAPIRWIRRSALNVFPKDLPKPEEGQSRKSSAKPAEASPLIHVDLNYHATTNVEAIASLIAGIGKIVEDVNSVSILLSVGQDCAIEAMKQRNHALPKPSIFISIA
jgi:hypothetical protein